jgi:sulfide:quinone oxidoreductase
MSDPRSAPTAPHVVIAGGGVAALEALMALHELARDRMRVTLVAPEPDFVYRPMSVAEPFGLGEPRRHPMRRLVSDFDASLVPAAVHAVLADERRVVLRSGDTLSYDTLILAPGARNLPAFDEVITFGEPGSVTAVRDLLAELARGTVRRIAFVAPTRAGWPLPLYELALMTGARARSLGIDSTLSLITRETQPLEAFGTEASTIVGDLLDAAAIEFIGSTYAEKRDGALRLLPGGRLLAVDRVVALPLVRGPRIDGVPREPQLGFIPVNRYGQVRGLPDVYCAGDAIDFPIKQGGLAAQQADTVAHHVAAHYGAPVLPSPWSPVLRGMLFTGDAQHFLRTDATGAEPVGAASSQPLWWPPTKIAGRYLAPYLFDRAEMKAASDPPAGFTDLGVPLEDEVSSHNA